MEPTPQQELDFFIEQELGLWAATVLEMLTANLKKQDLVLSGETLASLKSDVLVESANQLYGYNLRFANSGRHKDMTVRQKQLPPIDVIEEYVKEVGIAKFKYVPGYKAGQFPLTESAAINRIAWGIARHRLNQNLIKPKKWFARKFYSMINSLIDRVTRRYKDATGQAIAGSFNNL